MRRLCLRFAVLRFFVPRRAVLRLFAPPVVFVRLNAAPGRELGVDWLADGGIGSGLGSITGVAAGATAGAAIPVAELLVFFSPPSQEGRRLDRNPPPCLRLRRIASRVRRVILV